MSEGLGGEGVNKEGCRAQQVEHLQYVQSNISHFERWKPLMAWRSQKMLTNKQLVQLLPRNRGVDIDLLWRISIARLSLAECSWIADKGVSLEFSTGFSELFRCSISNKKSLATTTVPPTQWFYPRILDSDKSWLAVKLGSPAGLRFIEAVKISPCWAYKL